MRRMAWGNSTLIRDWKLRRPMARPASRCPLGRDWMPARRIAAIFAEILRAGIQSLPKGQREAGLAIGLRSFQSRMSVEFPQAIRRMLPSLVAQLVVLLKDT